MNLEWTAFEDRECLGQCRVEAIEYPEGLCYVVIFSGQSARELAIEYADWKNAHG